MIILIGKYKRKQGTSACTHHQRRGRSSLERVCVQGVCPCTRPPCQWCGGCGALPSGHSPGNEMRNARLCLNKGLQVKWSNNTWLQLFIKSDKLWVMLRSSRLYLAQVCARWHLMKRYLLCCFLSLIFQAWDESEIKWGSLILNGGLLCQNGWLVMGCNTNHHPV